MRLYLQVECLPAVGPSTTARPSGGPFSSVVPGAGLVQTQNGDFTPDLLNQKLGRGGEERGREGRGGKAWGAALTGALSLLVILMQVQV